MVFDQRKQEGWKQTGSKKEMNSELNSELFRKKCEQSIAKQEAQAEENRQEGLMAFQKALECRGVLLNSQSKHLDPQNTGIGPPNKKTTF